MCSHDEPCLFHVIDDPLEKNESAKQAPEVVARLRSELLAYVAGRFTGELDMAKTSQSDYCTWIESVGWVQPFEKAA